MTTTSSTTSSNIVNTLGAGSGIDIAALAKSLVEAERAPRKERIDAKVAQCETRISGYGALKFALSDLQKAFQAVDDASEFASLKVANSQEQALAVTAGANAAAGSYSVSVADVALAQRSVAGFAARGASLNGGQAFWVKLDIAGADTRAVKVTNPTPAGIVNAINGAKLAVKAQLVDTGSGAVVVLTGAEGARNAFTVTAVADDGQGAAGSDALSDVDFGTPQQAARDATFFVNGQRITRPSNTVSDVIDGVTFSLYTRTSGDARIDLQRDTSGIKDRLKALVTAYNGFQDSLDVLADPKSEVETYGGALAGDSLLRSIRSQVRQMVVGASTTASGAVSHARHAGIGIDRDGRMTLDEDRLDAALADSFQDTMVMFTAGKNAKSLYGAAPSGLAGEAVRTIDKMLRSTGLIAQNVKTTTAREDQYKKDLQRLEDRMARLLENYMRQFSAMDDIVGQANSTGASVSNSLASMLGND